jgi:hypothetical protein
MTFPDLSEVLTFQPYDSRRELRPGDVLKLRSGEFKIVGDVNSLLGVCDDCKDFESYEIVAVASLLDAVYCYEHAEWKTGLCPNSHT